MYYDKDDNVFTCPKCGRMITKHDVKLGRCVICDLDISLISKDLSMIQEETLLETFANEIKRSDRKIDYYETSISILKAYLVSAVCIKKQLRTTFFYVEDCEIKYFLFRLVDRKKFTFMEFDFIPKYRGVTRYTSDIIKSRNLGTMKSFIYIKDFEKLMDVAMGVYSTKKTSCATKEHTQSTSLYRFR